MAQYPPCLRDDILREETNSKEPRLLIDELILASDTRIGKAKRPSTLTWTSGLTSFACLRTKIADVAAPTMLAQLGNTQILETSVAKGVKSRGG